MFILFFSEIGKCHYHYFRGKNYVEVCFAQGDHVSEEKWFHYNIIYSLAKTL